MYEESPRTALVKGNLGRGVMLRLAGELGIGKGLEADGCGGGGEGPGGDSAEHG